MRFPLVKEPMRLKPENACRVFMACCTLHNFLINMGMGYLEGSDLESLGEPQILAPAPAPA